MAFIDNLNYATKESTHIFHMGQAGYIIKNKGGFTLGIDLYLSNCVEVVEGHDGYHRLMPTIVNPDELNLDVLIATHFHRDHFDIDSIPKLMANGKTHLICSYDCLDDVKRLDIDINRVSFVHPGDRNEYRGFKIYFTKCDHGIGAPLAIGTIITVDNYNILEVGDTCLHTDWKDEYLSTGPIDILIAPINGAYGNLNEEECIELVKCLQPKITIPCHFGMFPSHGGNPGLFIEQMRRINSPYKILTLGEDWEIKNI